MGRTKSRPRVCKNNHMNWKEPRLEAEHGEGKIVNPEAALREPLLHRVVLVHLAQQLRALLPQDALQTGRLSGKHLL